MSPISVVQPLLVLYPQVHADQAIRAIELAQSDLTAGSEFPGTLSGQVTQEL